MVKYPLFFALVPQSKGVPDGQLDVSYGTGFGERAPAAVVETGAGRYAFGMLEFRSPLSCHLLISCRSWVLQLLSKEIISNSTGCKLDSRMSSQGFAPLWEKGHRFRASKCSQVVRM